MHVPTLPSLPSWETPIAASREIADAIADVADSAVDAASNAVRSARRRRRGTPKLSPAMTWLAVAVVALAAIALVRARRSTSPAADAPARSDADASLGSRVDVVNDQPKRESAGVGANRVRTSTAD